MGFMITTGLLTALGLTLSELGVEKVGSQLKKCCRITGVPVRGIVRVIGIGPDKRCVDQG